MYKLTGHQPGFINLCEKSTKSRKQKKQAATEKPAETRGGGRFNFFWCLINEKDLKRSCLVTNCRNSRRESFLFVWFLQFKRSDQQVQFSFLQEGGLNKSVDREVIKIIFMNNDGTRLYKKAETFQQAAFMKDLILAQNNYDLIKLFRVQILQSSSLVKYSFFFLIYTHLILPWFIFSLNHFVSLLLFFFMWSNFVPGSSETALCFILMLLSDNFTSSVLLPTLSPTRTNEPTQF